MTQEGKVDYRYLEWCPSSRSEKYFACSADSCRLCKVSHYTNCIIRIISNFQMAQAAPPRVRPTTWCFALRLQMPNAGFLDCRGSSLCFLLHFQRHSTSNLWIGRLLNFLRCAGRQFRTYSRIFALLAESSSKIAEALSKDGFPTLEYRPRPLAGHLCGLAKIMMLMIVTEGRTPKSKPSLPHARTAAGNLNSSTA